jgi:hypothetical protein
MEVDMVVVDMEVEVDMEEVDMEATVVVGIGYGPVHFL